MILHLLPDSTWQRIRDDEHYAPESLAAEGFVHCTGDDATLLEVANRFYLEVEGDVVVLTLDDATLDAEVRWEPPAHPDGRAATADEPLFPHVYGPLRLASVVEVRTLRRAADGRYASIG